MVVDAPTSGGRNYLRVRGEYIGVDLWDRAVVELPPRARRIHAGV